MFLLCSHGVDVAIEILNVQRGQQADKQALEAFKREVGYLCQLNNHPNIVRLIGACDEYTQDQANGMLAIVMELAPFGSLFNMRERVSGRWV